MSSGAASDRHALAVEESAIQQHFHKGQGAPDGDEIGHEVFAGGFEVGEDRHAAADALEVIDAQFDASGVGDGGEVQHRVGRAT